MKHVLSIFRMPGSVVLIINPSEEPISFLRHDHASRHLMQFLMYVLSEYFGFNVPRRRHPVDVVYTSIPPTAGMDILLTARLDCRMDKRDILPDCVYFD
jgi:hypothetical protein